MLVECSAANTPGGQTLYTHLSSFPPPDLACMDKPSHLSVIIDSSPTQWALCAQSTNPPGITLQTFLSHLLAFLNAHIACKDENTLAVFGALPGQGYVFFSIIMGHTLVRISRCPCVFT